MSHAHTHDERSRWEPVKKMMGENEFVLGQHLSYHFLHTPRSVLYTMSHYKFAAKLIGAPRKVLDVGCGEGAGTWLLAKECGKAVGIDFDQDAVDIACRNWNEDRISFESGDFLESDVQPLDAVVAFDVIEHILPEHIDAFHAKVGQSLQHDGIAVFGTPNITADKFASPVGRAGHVNMYSGEKLEEEMRRYYHHVFLFGANDEVIHTGFLPMAHYLVAVGCRKRA